MKQFAVIGLGRFGICIAKTLYQMGHNVLAVDSSMEKVEEVADYVTHAVQADITDEANIKSLGIRNFDCAIIAIGTNMQASILAAMLCKEAGVPMVLAKAQSDLHAKILQKMGADRIVFPERDMGEKTAQSLVSDSIIDYIELSPEYSLVEIATPFVFVGKSLKTLDVRSVYRVNIMAIKSAAGEINATPSGDDIIRAGDMLILIGRNTDINKLQNLSGKHR